MNPLSRVALVVLGLLACGLLLALPAVAQACPTCKDQLAQDAATSGFARGFFWSILFMLSIPAALLATWVVYMVYQLGKAEEESERAALAARAAGRGASPAAMASAAPSREAPGLAAEG